MVLGRGRSCLVLVLATASLASAQPKSAAPPLVGVTEVAKLTAATGFVDDVVASTDQTIAYITADNSTKTDLHLFTIGQPQEVVVDLKPFTLHPVALRLVGARAFVIAATEDGRFEAALVELTATGKTKPAGTIVYKLQPATHMTIIMRDGKQRLAIDRVTTLPTGARHDVQVVAIETGKPVAVARSFEVDTKNANAKLELRINHWADGMTRAIGLKGGEWNKKADQRTPDVEATYDLPTGRFVDQHPIEDLFEQRKRYQTLADAHGELDFLRMAWDNSGVQVWHNAKLQAVTLDQPITNYDFKSLQGVVNADGSAWIVLQVDPVNPDAVARKKADPEYLDIFKSGSDGKAVRKARILATGVHYKFGLAGDRFWLLERSAGFDRGGRSLALYQLRN
ncbi:MAG: hypothetical protein JWO36_2710 [Myxococcales bacterium]|nr:hypothetical protein [Myxococcales bacterium]